MTKPVKPLSQFIDEYLLHDYAKLSDNLNANDRALLAQADSYLEHQREYSVAEIISLRIKLFEYYSCMRQFHVANTMQAEINNLLTDCESKLISGFETPEFKAEFLLLQGIQCRNHKPVQDFVKSEEYFKHSEEIYLALFVKGDKSPSMQRHMNEYFRALMNRLGLYINYDTQLDKANELIGAMDKMLENTIITFPAYLSLYYYCVGSLYLNTNKFDQAVRKFKLATEQIELATEHFWSEMEYKPLLSSKLAQAQDAAAKNAVTEVAPDAFFQPFGETGAALNSELNPSVH